MSIAQSIPAAEALRELADRDNSSADIFELPHASEDETPVQPSNRIRIVAAVVGTLLAVVLLGWGYQMLMAPETIEIPVEPVPTAQPAVATAPATWVEAEPRFESLEATPKIEAPAPTVTAVQTVTDTPAPVSTVEANVAEVETSVVNASPVQAEPGDKQQPVALDNTVVPVSIEELESRVLANVRRSLFQNDRRSAKAALVDFMQEHGETAESKALLAGLLLQEGQVRPARALLADVSRATVSAKLRLLKARILSESGDLTGAISLLETVPPAIEEMSEYHALLALLYKQTRQYENSARLYGELAKFDETNFRWQLGHAISLEGAGNLVLAKAAYERVLSNEAMPRSLADYAYSRLRVVSYRL